MTDRLARNVTYLAAIGAVLYGLATYSDPLFHTTLEAFCMVVAASVLIVAWNGRRLLDTDYLLLIGVSYLFFAVLDVPHILSFEGIDLFAGYTADLPAQLYLLQRFMLAGSFVLAPAFLTRRLPIVPAFAVYAGGSAVALYTIFVSRTFPAAFVQGGAFTPFKIASEAIIVSLFLLATLALWVHRPRFDPSVFWLLVGTNLTFAASEVFFASSTVFSDQLNLLGHYVQGLAFFLTYKAVVETAYLRPYTVLYKDLADSAQAVRESEERYREVAETLQTALLRLPERMEGVSFTHRYRSSSDIARIGGDFYDLFELEGGRIGLLLGDVSGKGLEAAAVTAQVKSTVRAFAYLDAEPSAVLRRTNDALYRQLGEAQFVTALYAVLERDTGVLRLASAGHEEPVICMFERCELEHLAPNVPLGVVPQADFRGSQLRFGPGDGIVAYTDGITEARRGSELFGRERVASVVHGLDEREVGEVADRLLSAALEFAEGHLVDDVAVLGLQLDARSEALSGAAPSRSSAT